MEEKQNMNAAPPPYPGQEAPSMGYQGAPAPGQPGSYPPGEMKAPSMGYQGAPAPGQPGSYPPGEMPPASYQYGPPPSASGYAAIPPGPPHITAATTTVVVHQNFGSIPAACACPNCHQNVVTRTDYETGLFTWLIVGIIIICGGWIFCLCLIPFCVDSMKDVRHVCPNCNYTIHYHKRM